MYVHVCVGCFGFIRGSHKFDVTWRSRSTSRSCCHIIFQISQKFVQCQKKKSNKKGKGPWILRTWDFKTAQAERTWDFKTAKVDRWEKKVSRSDHGCPFFSASQTPGWLFQDFWFHGGFSSNQNHISTHYRHTFTIFYTYGVSGLQMCNWIFFLFTHV